MPKKVRAMMTCDTCLVRSDYGDKKTYEYEFSAVSDGSDEKESFFRHTPYGSLKIGVFREDYFEVGKDYYLDFILAEPNSTDPSD